MSETFVLPAYTVHEKLGEGAMGEVYRATHRTTGQTVAVKRVRTGSGDDLGGGGGGGGDAAQRNRSALMAEFQTLASLHHPHVISVLDYGLAADGQPYFAMELLQHPQTIMEAMQGQPLEMRIESLLQVLRALTYLHRSGIVHRDLKPSNVLVNHGAVKVVDFGVATQEGSGVQNLGGTPAYMAPELFLGGMRSESADLFALGVLAYEILFERFPFDMADRNSMLSCILGTAPSSLLGDVTDESFATLATEQHHVEEQHIDLRGSAAEAHGPFKAVVERLLARNPEERYHDSREVIADISRVLGRELQQETEETRESMLRAARFVGREKEFQVLADVMHKAVQGQGSAWLLGGESGVGKSRIMEELRTVALLQGADVVRGQAINEGSRPYHVWINVARALVTQSNVSDAQASVLADIVDDLPTLLGRPVDKAPALAPAAMQKRLCSTFEALLRAYPRPMLLLLEDMHWAGPDSLALLTALQGAIPQCTLLVVGSYRNDEAPNLPGKLPFMSLITLERLSENAVAELARVMLGQRKTHDGLAQFLHAQTEGNVFFLIEAIRELAGELGAADTRNLNTLSSRLLTGGIRSVVERRLRNVPAEHLPLLQAAAIFGRGIDLRLLAQVFPQADLQEWLTACGQAAILSAQEAQWRFAHDKLRELLLAGLTAEQSRSLHLTAAHAVEKTYPDALQQNAPQLAHHYDGAGVPDKAAGYYRQAAASATQFNAFAQARSHYTRALQMLDQLPAGATRQRDQVDVILDLSNVTWATETAERSLALLQQGADALEAVRQAGASGTADSVRRARLLLNTGRVHYAQLAFGTAGRYYSEAVELVRTLGNEQLFTVASFAAGFNSVLSGHFADGVKVLQPAMDHVEKHSGFIDHARCVGVMTAATVLTGDARLDDAVEANMTVIRRAQTMQQPTALLFASTYLPAVYLFAGDNENASAAAARGVDVAQGVGERLFLFIVCALSSWANIRAGRYTEAVAARDQAASIEKVLGGRVLVSDWFALARMEIALHAKQWSAAQEECERLIAWTEAADAPFSQGVASRSLALAHLQGDVQRLHLATPHFERAVSCLAGPAGASLEAARTYALWAKLRREAGEAEAAQTLQAKADSIFTGARTYSRP